MKASVYCVKVKLNLANNVVNYELITIDFTYRAAELKDMTLQFSLTLF